MLIISKIFADALRSTSAVRSNCLRGSEGHDRRTMISLRSSQMATSRSVPTFAASWQVTKACVRAVAPGRRSGKGKSLLTLGLNALCYLSTPPGTPMIAATRLRRLTHVPRTRSRSPKGTAREAPGSDSANAAFSHPRTAPRRAPGFDRIEPTVLTVAA